MTHDSIQEVDDSEFFEDDEETQLLTRKELTNSRTRLRNMINRDAANSDKRARQLASQLLSQQHPINVKEKERLRRQGAILSSLGALSGKVLNSMGITPRVTIEQLNAGARGPSMNCYTDFVDVNIQINCDQFDLSDEAQVVNLVHTVKGFTYHEGGHIMWSTPPDYLCSLAGCNKGNDHCINGSLIKPYLDPHVASSVIGKSISGTMFHQAWNILEDQRMESAMVVVSPVMARYFATLVAKYIYDPGKEEIAWPWIVGRTYLPRELRQMLRNAAEKHKCAKLIPDIEDVVMTYRSSNDPKVMHSCVIRLAEILIVWLEGKDGLRNPDVHGTSFGYGKVGVNRNKIQAVPESSDFTIEKPEEPKAEASGTKGNDGEEVEVPDSGEHKDDNPPETEESSAGSQSAEKTVKSYFDDIVSDSIAQMSHGEAGEFLANVNDNLRQVAARDESITPMAPDEIREVANIQNSMMDVLDRLIVQVDPSWMFYRENGVLDPTAFITREPGDMNFWSGMDGDKGNGHDLAVSLLVDTSGSMDHRIGRTSAVTMGIRKACEHYDIPCTITTFSDRVRLVAAGDEQVEHVKLGAGGGTHIFDALTILDDQRYGKRYHLVVILTDGEWSDIKDVRAWGDPGRHILIVGIDVNHDLIANKGGNSAVTIYNPADLAPLVTNALAGYFIN